MISSFLIHHTLTRRLLGLCTVVCVGLLLYSASARAQVVPKRIGILSAGFNAEVTLSPGSPRGDTLRAALARLGYREGRDVVFITRVAPGGVDSLNTAARELVSDSVDLIVAGGSTEALAAEHATSHIPIVFWSAEPIAEGLVDNLERPGRNATGIIPTANGVIQRLEILNLVAPGSSPIGVLYNSTYLPGVGIMQRTQLIADSLGIRLVVIEARAIPQIDSAFAQFELGGVRAVLINNHGLFRVNAAHLAELSLRYQLPMLSPYPEARDAGTLIASVPDFVFWSRRAAIYVDRILRGEKPSELPVEQSVPQRFTISSKTAAVLRLQIPRAAILRAQLIK